MFYTYSQDSDELGETHKGHHMTLIRAFETEELNEKMGCAWGYGYIGGWLTRVCSTPNP